jgi:hypothetical protein
VFIDKQYSKIILDLLHEHEHLIDFQSIRWYSKEEEMSDIFIQVFIRMAERKFIDSEHDVEELKEFVSKYNMPNILKDIMKYLLEEDLLKEFGKEVVAHETIYAILGLESE